MNYKYLITILILVSSLSMVHAQEAGLMLEMQIVRNGEQVAAPKVWSKLGKESAVQVGTAIRIEVTTADLGTKADMQFNVYTERNGQLALAGQPRLHAIYDATSSFKIKGEDGVEYEIRLQPIKKAQP